MQLETIKQRAPSIFAAQPAGRMSSKYKFISTAEILKKLIEKGFTVTKAQQQRTLNPDNVEFTKHIIRLRLASPETNPGAVNDLIPEIVITNSHNGTSAYSLMLGIFRLVCLNGLVVSSSLVEQIRVIHSGRSAEEVLAGSFNLIDKAPAVINRIETWQKIELTTAKRLEFAARAYDLTKSVNKPDPERLLRPRRNADAGADLWRTFNVVQENIIKGGLLARVDRGAEGYRYTHTREINSINKDININKDLWQLAEEFGKE